jgi:uncharacterized membrane protein YGL010W
MDPALARALEASYDRFMARPRWLSNWLERHRHPASLALHAVGIPMLVFALCLAAWQLYSWRWDLWWRPAGLLVISYVLQWIGHAIEGNDLGEVVLIKRLLGKPYIAVAPRRRSQPVEGELREE